MKRIVYRERNLLTALHILTVYHYIYMFVELIITFRIHFSQATLSSIDLVRKM